jgi:fructoselysine-6-P-deglycase FrlB-like protein
VTVAAEPMLEDIRRQPAAWSGLLERAGELGGFGAALAPDPGGTVHVVGCGDGWFAARALALPAARGLGLPYLGVSALECLLYHAPRMTAADRVMAVSMSGDVDRTIEAWEAIAARGARGLAVTNGAGARLGRLAPSVSLELPVLAPFLSGTATYTTTLLAAAFLLEGATAGAGPADPAWRIDRAIVAEAIGWLPGVIEEADRFARALAGSVAGRGAAGVRLLAAGPHLATADYGAAKLVELTRVRVWADDMEEFAHRQFWSADPRELVVYLAPSAGLARRAAEAAAALAEMGFPTAAIETAEHAVPPATHRLSLPAMPEWLALLVFPVALQLLGYHLARATDLDPNTRAHLKEDTRRFRVSRRLTRRPLVSTGA